MEAKTTRSVSKGSPLSQRYLEPEDLCFRHDKDSCLPGVSQVFTCAQVTLRTTDETDPLLHSGQCSQDFTLRDRQTVPYPATHKIVPHYTHRYMRDAQGKPVRLKNRDKVLHMLRELHNCVALPICQHFGLRYESLSEQHCQEKKAGVTVKTPLVRKSSIDVEGTHEIQYLLEIRLRIRVHPSSGDPQSLFIARGTQLAVLLHELCHLKHMNHGTEFMLLLRQVYAIAAALGVFSPRGLVNEIPSPWAWENRIFETAGHILHGELVDLFNMHQDTRYNEEILNSKQIHNQRRGSEDHVHEELLVLEDRVNAFNAAIVKRLRSTQVEDFEQDAWQSRS